MMLPAKRPKRARFCHYRFDTDNLGERALYACELRSSMFSELQSNLETLRCEKFVYVPNPGNAGDSFIACATYLLLDRMGLDYETGHHSATFPNRTVIFGGGGNLVAPYRALDTFLRKNADVAKRLIVLPQTMRAYGETLSALGPNCTLFCRDLPSFDYATKHAAQANVLLAHDMAFGLNVEEAMQRRCREQLNLKRVLVTARYRALSRHTLNCFRSDSEKTNVDPPPLNLDISGVLGGTDMQPETCLRVTRRMIRFVRDFETVNTNRLHVAILSAMLGKKVNMFDNSYGKNRAVFEHSIAGRFDNVQWCE